ncbi:MAG: DUF86 domain-containing protein [Planctomycetaceae bacterium]|nr:DUF86 domain-containing protein [Planctomycetaceae bacterium]
MKDDLNYVGHILDCARRIQRHTLGITREAFDSNEILQLAITHLIQTAGEAARKLTPAFRQLHPQVPWNQIVGMRHRLVHDYLNIDIDVVWQVSTVDVPKLISQLAPILSESAGDAS